MEKPIPTYSLREAAQMLGRSERYVWNAVREGKIAAKKDGRAMVSRRSVGGGVRTGERDSNPRGQPSTPPPRAAAQSPPQLELFDPGPAADAYLDSPVPDEPVHQP